MLYFQQQIFSFLACFSSIHIKAPNFPIIPEWLHIEENQNEYHPDALNNVHDRELQLYISQFFIVQVQRMNHQKFIWNIISLERATLSILVEWRAVEKSFDEKANDVAMTADMEARPSMEVTRIGFNKRVPAQIIRGADCLLCQSALNKCLTILASQMSMRFEMHVRGLKLFSWNCCNKCAEMAASALKVHQEWLKETKFAFNNRQIPLWVFGGDQEKSASFQSKVLYSDF